MAPVDRAGADSHIPEAGRSRTLAVTALSLGIAAVLVGWLLVAAGALLGVSAAIVGLVALSRIRNGVEAGRRQAITGVVLGTLGIATTIGINMAFLLAN